MCYCGTRCTPGMVLAYSSQMIMCCRSSLLVDSASCQSLQRAARIPLPSRLAWTSPSVHLASFFVCLIFPPRLCFCFIREGLRRTVCSDSCSNSYTRFQRADVFTGASHAYFPRGDAFRRRPELELKWPFTRNTSWETGGAEWQNTPWPDADGVVCVCVCLSYCG